MADDDYDYYQADAPAASSREAQWEDWQPPREAAVASPQQRDGWEDWQPPETTAAAAQGGWEDWQPPKEKAEPEGVFATGLRHLAHAIPSVVTGLGTGALYGAVGGPGGMIGGALAGGAAALGQSYLQSKATEAYWPEEAERLRAGAEENPKSAVVGGVAAVAPFIGVGGLSREALKSSVGQRAVSALLSGGTDVGQQLGFTGTVDPTQAAIQTAGGAVFGGAPTALGRKVMGIKPQPHGTPGPEVSSNTAQEAKPTTVEPTGDPQNRATLGTGELETGGENLNTRDYGKTPAATGEASGVNVLKDGVDPTLASTFKAETTPTSALGTAAEPPTAAVRPPMEAPPPEPGGPTSALGTAAEPVRPPTAGAAPTGLLPEKQPFYAAAKAAAPNLPEEQLTHIANLAGGPKGAALMARNAARRMGEDVGAPAARVAETERAPVPAGTMELPPVEVKPPGVEVPPKAVEAIATSKAAEAVPQVLPRPEQPKTGFNKAALKARRAQREGKEPSGLTPEDYAAMDAELGVKPGETPTELTPIPGSKAAQRAEAAQAVAQFEAKKKPSGVSYNLTTPEGRAAQAAAEAAPAEPAAPRRPSTDYTGKLNPDISHTEYVNRLEELRANKPRPVERLWRDPTKAPAEQVNAAAQAIRDWNREYRAVQRNQKLALPRDNAKFRVETLRQEAAARITEPSAEALAERADPGVAPTSAGAAAAPPPAPPSTPVQPTARERVTDTLRKAYDTLLDVGGKTIEEIKMAVAPMAAGPRDSPAHIQARGIAKTQADAIRRIDYEWQVADDHITKARDPVTKKLLFDDESRKAMWDRADEESVMRQRGETSEHMGIATLEPHERALVESFQPKARELWDMARDIGWVHGEGLPFYTPRMFEGIVSKVEGSLALDAKGRNIQTTTPGVKHRKHLEAETSEAAAKAAFGEEAKIIRDIRTMPLALAKMEKALINRMMIKKIEDVGRQTGQHLVVEGTSKPGPGWFTVPDNPAFYTHRPRYEQADTATYRAAAEARSGVEVPAARIPLFDRNGNPVIDRVPLWVPSQFEGPLKAIMTKSLPLVERGLMELKGKTMSVIMNSPLIHNAVEWGRALPTMPGKMITFQTYFEGNAAKKGVPYNGTIRYVRDWMSGKLEAAPRNASPTMIEAIDTGTVPIGKRFFNQDITSIMESPDLTPGRSLTAKALAMVPDLYDPKAGLAVKKAIDKAGDFWHNTMLWDRIGDLQMGLFVNAKRDILAKNPDMPPRMAAYVASHIANRYAGALPNEAMSNGARKIANFMMFSRTFTLGNLGVLKDMVTGLPRDVQAKMMKEFGYVDPKSMDYVKSIARRKAMMAVGLDVGLMYIGNSILQSAFNLMKDDNTLGKEGEGYVRRFNDALQRIKENPLSLINPITALGTVESLSATFENEPGKHDRIKVGETKEGRGVYMRNPVGKIGEEFVGYATGPLDMMKRKMGTIARPAWQILSNDKGFGEKIYDPHAEMLSGKQLESAVNIGKVMFLAQTPEGQLTAAKDLLTGQGGEKIGNVPVAALQALGPIAGVTFSRGHPGGPAAGEAFRLREEQKFEQGPELKDVRKMVRDGRTDEAVQRLNELGVTGPKRRQILNPHMSPRDVRNMYRTGSPEQQGRFRRAREARE